MASYTYQIEGGGVLLNVTVTEADGGLMFDVAVDESTGYTGDLNAFYLDIVDETLLDGLTITGTEVTGTRLDENSVTKVDNFTNMNGEAIKEAGKFDIGVQFGTQGMAADDIQSTSFFVSHETETLSIDDFASLDTGVRLTSVGEVDGSRDGSLKLTGTTDVVEVPTDEDPVVDEPVLEGPVDPEEPVVEDPVVDEPVLEGPVDPEEPVVEDPVLDGPVILEEPIILEGPVTTEDLEDSGIVTEGAPVGDEEFVFTYEDGVSEGPVGDITAEEDIFPASEPVLTDEEFMAEISIPVEEADGSEFPQEEIIDDSDWAVL